MCQAQTNLFSPKRSDEAEFFTFDFSPLLADGETLLTAVWTIEDPSMTPEDPAIGTGTTTQLIQGGVAGKTYSITCMVTTSLAQTLVLIGRLPVTSV